MLGALVLLTPSAAHTQLFRKSLKAADTEPQAAGGRRHGILQPKLRNYAITGSEASQELPLWDHGGVVLKMVPTVVFVLHGDRWTNSRINLLDRFGRGLSNSSWLRVANYSPGIATTYVYGGHTHSSYVKPGGGVLTDDDIAGIVRQKLDSGFRFTPSTVYLVLTSGEVSVNGFCSAFCGWHDFFLRGSARVLYGFVGDPVPQCPQSCAPQTISPNGDQGLDAMVNVIAHEVTESITNPQFDAWFDDVGLENADKCAWTFGETLGPTPGPKYNNDWGLDGRWLIQRQTVLRNGQSFCGQPPLPLA